MQTNKLKKQLDPQPLNGILKSRSLAHIIQKAKLLLSINQFLKDVLPSELAPSCQVMNIEDGILTVAAKTSAVATRLRYLQQDIIDKLCRCDNLSFIRALIVKVRIET